MKRKDKWICKVCSEECPCILEVIKGAIPSPTFCPFVKENKPNWEEKND